MRVYIAQLRATQAHTDRATHRSPCIGQLAVAGGMVYSAAHKSGALLSARHDLTDGLAPGDDRPDT